MSSALVALALGQASGLPARANSASPVGVTASQVMAAGTLQATITKQWTLSYRATWTYEFKGKVTSYSLGQSPPSTRFVATNGAWDETVGGRDYFHCAPAMACPRVNGVDPLFQTRNLFVGVEASDELGGFNSTPANAPAGFRLSFSTFNFAGLASTCVTVYDGSSFSQEWCVAHNGVVTYGRYAGRLLVLTNFQQGLPSSAVTLPPGALRVEI